MKWVDWEDQAFLCEVCLAIIIPDDGVYWKCECKDLKVFEALPEEFEKPGVCPERWIRGKRAFVPWTLWSHDFDAKWSDGWDQAFFCLDCLMVVTPENLEWLCDCGVATYGDIEHLEIGHGGACPDRWLRGKSAFFPWKDED